MKCHDIGSSLENTFPYINDVVGLHRIGHLGRKLLDSAIRIFPMETQATIRCRGVWPAALSQSLHDRHSAFDAICPGPLGFPVDIENGRTMHIDDVPPARNISSSDFSSR